MSKIPIIMFLVIFLIGVLFSGCAKQDRFSGERDFNGMRGPPGEMSPEQQEMFKQMQEKAQVACQGKQEGDACTTDSPRGEMSGICTLMEDVLSCRSELPDMQDMQGRQGTLGPGSGQGFEEMQQKAKAACQDKTEGDACAMETPRGEMQGKCTLMEDALSCRQDMPNRQGMPPGQQGLPDMQNPQQ